VIEYVPYDGHRCIHELFNCTPEHADHFEHDLYKSLDETTAIEVAVNLYTIHDLYNHLTKLRIEFPHITKVLLDFDFTSYKSLSYIDSNKSGYIHDHLFSIDGLTYETIGYREELVFTRMSIPHYFKNIEYIKSLYWEEGSLCDYLSNNFHKGHTSYDIYSTMNYHYPMSYDKWDNMITTSYNNLYNTK
jgi:hypothetical protein